MSVLADIDRWKGEAASSSRARARKSTRVVEQKGRYMVSKSGIPSPATKRKPFSDITNMTEKEWGAPSIKRGAASRPAWGSPSKRGGSRKDWGSPSRRTIVMPDTPETPRMDVAAFLRGSTNATTPPAAVVSAPAAPPPMSPELDRFSISTNLMTEDDEEVYQEDDMQEDTADEQEQEGEDDDSFSSQEELRVKALVAKWLHSARESDAEEKAMAVNAFEEEVVAEEQQEEQEPEENAEHIQEEGDGERLQLELECDSPREYPLSFHSFQEAQETTEPEPEPEREPEPDSESESSKRDLDEVMAARPQRGIVMDAVLDSSASVDVASPTATDDRIHMPTAMPMPRASKSTRLFLVMLICLPLVYVALCTVPALQVYMTAMTVSANQCMTIAQTSAASALESAGPVLETMHATALEAVAVARAAAIGHMAALEAPWREWSMAWAILMEQSTPRLTQATGALSEVVIFAADDFHRRLLEITMGEEELAHLRLLKAGDSHDTFYVRIAALVGLTGLLGIWASRYLAAPKKAVPSV